MTTILHISRVQSMYLWFNNLTLDFPSNWFNGKSHLGSVIPMFFKIFSEVAIFFLDTILIEPRYEKHTDNPTESGEATSDKERTRIAFGSVGPTKVINNLEVRNCSRWWKLYIYKSVCPSKGSKFTDGSGNPVELTSDCCGRELGGDQTNVITRSKLTKCQK